LSLRNSFDQVYNGQGQFSLDEKIDRGVTDTPNPDIHILTYLPNLCQRPAFRATPTQSRKIVLRPVDIKDFFLVFINQEKGNYTIMMLGPKQLR
jgi:hypothetical protein